jgi:cathepsin D
MIAAIEMSEVPFKSFNFDGVLGLGLDGLSETPDFNFVHKIASAVSSWGGAMPNVFAVFLADTPNEESEISFGGWHAKHHEGQIYWNSLFNPVLGHWVVNVTNISIDGVELDYCQDGTCKAVVDTGTSLVAVPTKIFPELYEGLKHSAHRAGHCKSKGPEFQIQLDNFVVRLDARDYAQLERAPNRAARARLKPDTNRSGVRNTTRPTRRDMFCKPQLMTMDLPAPLGPKLFILGEPVLRKYYTVYDRHENRVGFGKAVHAPSRSIEEAMLAADDHEDPETGKLPNREMPKSMFQVLKMKKQLR